jgi:hypothetical protein
MQDPGCRQMIDRPATTPTSGAEPARRHTAAFFAPFAAAPTTP